MNQKIKQNLCSTAFIEPLSEEEPNRPLWSVMIPAYNRPEYLKETLLSVLCQDPGPNKMQIEVVDNCSSTDSIETIVQQIGKGRISYYRQKETVDYIDNWNTCIRRAKGHWVHILHDDDIVLKGFYDSYQNAIEFDPDIGMVTCRCNNIDENGIIISMTKLLQDKSGILQDHISKMFIVNTIYAPSVTVKRNIYEAIGGFSHRCFAVSDWDMWKRIAVIYPVWYQTDILFSYRIHRRSGSSTVLKSGLLHKSTRESVEVSKDYYDHLLYNEIRQKSHKLFYDDAMRIVHKFIDEKDFNSARNVFREALKFDVPSLTKCKGTYKCILISFKALVKSKMPQSMLILIRRIRRNRQKLIRITIPKHEFPINERSSGPSGRPTAADTENNHR